MDRNPAILLAIFLLSFLQSWGGALQLNDGSDAWYYQCQQEPHLEQKTASGISDFGEETASEKTEIVEKGASESVVHMNGRIYDPLLGRFLSADPVVQFPGDLQSYNRYSYVLNNPVRYTDPSGHTIPNPALVSMGRTNAFGSKRAEQMQQFDLAIDKATTKVSASLALNMTPLIGDGIGIYGDASTLLDSEASGWSKGFAISGLVMTAAGPSIGMISRSFDHALDEVSAVSRQLDFFDKLDNADIDAGLDVTLDTLHVGDKAESFALTLYEPWPHKSFEADGFLGGYRQVETAEKGRVLSRIGSLEGNYLSPPGTTLSQRGLPSSYPNKTETLWEVVKPFEMESGIASAWKDAGGLGIQHKTEKTVQNLWDEGYIKELLYGNK